MNKAPIFQHRHYKAIAAVLAGMGREAYHGKEQTWTQEEIAAILAYMFASDNPRFDHDRFIAACSGKPSNGRDKVRS